MKIAARSSRLSRAQVREIQNLLPELSLEPIYVETVGDLDQKTSLRVLSKTDFFTREIDQLLLKRKVRAGIHSAKDLPDPLPKGLCIAAITGGADPRDCIVLKDGVAFEDLPPGASIATSSMRREETVKAIRDDLTFVDLRGDIETRLKKPGVEGVVIAEAALVRLGLTHLNRYFLPGDTADLQGRLAVVVHEEDEEAREIFKVLHEERPWTILHLGLDPTTCPSQGRIYHYPVIRTAPILEGQKELQALWPFCTHLVFTSKSAVRYLPSGLSFEGKTIVAIGEGTASLLPSPLIAKEATQEGVAALLDELNLKDAVIGWPRSSISREGLLRTKCTHVIDLYETMPHQGGAPPPLEAFDEIVFMSSSCVEGFRRIYGTALPRSKITVQGPITLATIDRLLGESDDK